MLYAFAFVFQSAMSGPADFCVGTASLHVCVILVILIRVVFLSYFYVTGPFTMWPFGGANISKKM